MLGVMCPFASSLKECLSRALVCPESWWILALGQWKDILSRAPVGSSSVELWLPPESLLESDLDWHSGFPGRGLSQTLLQESNNIERGVAKNWVSGGERKLGLLWKFHFSGAQNPWGKKRVLGPGDYIFHGPKKDHRVGAFWFKTVNRSGWWFRKLLKTRMKEKRRKEDG